MEDGRWMDEWWDDRSQKGKDQKSRWRRGFLPWMLCGVPPEAQPSSNSSRISLRTLRMRFKRGLQFWYTPSQTEPSHSIENRVGGASSWHPTHATPRKKETGIKPVELKAQNSFLAWSRPRKFRPTPLHGRWRSSERLCVLLSRFHIGPRRLA